VVVDGQEQRVDHDAEVVVAGQGLDAQEGVDDNHDWHDTQMAGQGDRQDTAAGQAVADADRDDGEMAVARQDVDHAALLEVRVFLGWYASDVHEHPRGWWEGRVAQDYGEVK